MLKKIIAASTMLVLFACSSIDDGFVYGSSDSQGNVEGDSSSSSQNNSEVDDSSSSSSAKSEPEPSSSSNGAKEVLISRFSERGGISPLFNTYPYGYTLKNNKDEDLTQFWTCPPEESSTITPIEAIACTLEERPTAILQNKLTTRDSPLHYIINNMQTENPSQDAIKLIDYNLTEIGDQAALGLNTAKDGLGALDGVAAFSYYYNGGAHKFRVSVDNANYWEADVPAVTKETLVTINVGDLKGMGSFAADATPLDISKATKFLWVVEYDAETAANNQGSLLVFLFNALVE